MKMHLNMSSAKWRPFCPGRMSYRQASTSPVTTKAVTLTTFPSLCKGCHSLYCRLCLRKPRHQRPFPVIQQFLPQDVVFSIHMVLSDAEKLSDINPFRWYLGFGSLHHIHVRTQYHTLSQTKYFMTVYHQWKIVVFYCKHTMHRKSFCITVLFRGESTGHRWI